MLRKAGARKPAATERQSGSMGSSRLLSVLKNGELGWPGRRLPTEVKITIEPKLN